MRETCREKIALLLPAEKKKKKEKPHKVTRESGIRTARFKLNRKCSHIIPVAQVTGVRKVSVDNALT